MPYTTRSSLAAAEVWWCNPVLSATAYGRRDREAASGRPRRVRVCHRTRRGIAFVQPSSISSRRANLSCNVTFPSTSIFQSIPRTCRWLMKASVSHSGESPTNYHLYHEQTIALGSLIRPLSSGPECLVPQRSAHSASASCMINLAARSKKGNGLVTCFSSRILPSGVSYPSHLKSTRYDPASAIS